MFDSDYYFEHDFDFTDLENSFLKLVSEQGQITDTVKKEYIATARLKYMPVGEWDELCKKFKELLHFRDNYKLCNFYKDNIKLNNKMYAAPCNLSEWYKKTRTYETDRTLYEFFTRYEIAKYTEDDYKEYEKFRKECNKGLSKEHAISDNLYTPGKEYLKKSTVIIDMKTGEECPITVNENKRGYIVYDRYYRPTDSYELYDIKTGHLILKYGYGSIVDSQNYVFFPAICSRNEPKKLYMLTKETGKVTEIV